MPNRVNPIIENKKLTIDSKYYMIIMNILKEEALEARIVGGAVRDALLGKNNSDIDISVAAEPEKIIETLSNKNIKVLPTGLEFGTVTAFFEDEKFEITSLRKDLSCDGRRAVVSFSNDFAEDAGRRDFTINALSYCPFEHKIYDYSNGLKDLEEEKVVFIGNPKTRIKEDFLRILRFFRFSSYYAKDLDPDGLESCVELKNNLTILSKERIKLEIDKLLKSVKAPITLKLMFEVGILQMLFPINRDVSKFLDLQNKFAKENLLKLSNNSKYAILFSFKPDLAIDDLLQLKFSRKEASKIMDFVSFSKELDKEKLDFTLKKTWINNDDYEEFINFGVGLNKIEPKEAKEFIEKFSNIEKIEFPLNGDDLLKIGVTGKVLGEILDKVKNFWIEKDFEPEKEELFDEVFKLLRRKPSSSFLAR